MVSGSGTGSDRGCEVVVTKPDRVEAGCGGPGCAHLARSLPDRVEAGRELLAQLSPGFEASLHQTVGEIAPHFAERTVALVFGELYSGGALDLKSRQIANIAVLTTLGAHEQLRVHLRIARRVGLTADEVADLLQQLAVYAGWPRAIPALQIAADVYTGPEEGGSEESGSEGGEPEGGGSEGSPDLGADPRRN